MPDPRRIFAKPPKAPAGTPEPPAEMGPVALEEWHRMVARMEGCGTLSKVDDAVIYQYAQLFAETEHLAVQQATTSRLIAVAEATLGAEEMSGEAMSVLLGAIAKLKQVEGAAGNQVRAGRMAIRQYLAELGQTPSARGKVSATAAEAPVDKWDGLVS